MLSLDEGVGEQYECNEAKLVWVPNSKKEEEEEEEKEAEEADDAIRRRGRSEAKLSEDEGRKEREAVAAIEACWECRCKCTTGIS